MEKSYGVLAIIFAILTVLSAGTTGYPDAPLAGSIIAAAFAIASKIGNREPLKN